MRHFRLCPIPLCERIDLAQVFGIRYSVCLPGTERVLVGFHAGEILAYEIRRTPELVTFVEEFQPVLLELDPGDARNKDQDQNAEGPEQCRAV